MKTQVVQNSIILHDGKILILRRSPTSRRRPLQWGLVGGFLENNEELIAGIVREVFEESGMKVSNPNPVFAKTELRSWIEDDTKNQENVIYIFYLVKSETAEVVLSSEHVEFKWMTLEEALNELEYPLHKEVLQYILDNQLID